ncbi:MAG: hypothetical protein AAFO95_04675 [Cyanobacteria bacterium J06600_6]
MTEKSHTLKIFESWLDRGRRHFRRMPILIWLNAFTIFVLSGLSLYAKIKSKGDRIDSLFIDPFYSSHYYYGWLTSVSEILWCAAIAICLFSALLLPKASRRYQTFLWGSSIVMLVLFFDDRFRLTLLLCAFFGTCKIVKLGVYSIYGILLVSYAVIFRRTIRLTPYFPLLIAFFLFGFSSAIDITPIASRGVHAMLEDGTKLIGLINLTIYFWWVCQQEIKKNIVQK